MIKHVFPGIGLETSALGFGCMRLPVDAEKKIDESKAIGMIRRAIENGVTYIDTAYPYHSGASELLVGKALSDGWRDRVTLATKLPVWKVETHEDMMKLLDEQLTKLKTDHVDFYLLHAMNADRLDKMRKLDYPRFLEDAVKAGKVRYPAFSFHDNARVFLEILNDYDWKMCQVQMNILDGDTQATLEGIREAGRKGVGVVVMEPLRGGLLANPPENVRALYTASASGRSPVEWAFRYLLAMPEVITILSGMSTPEQVTDNVRIFSAEDAGTLSGEEVKLFADVKEAYLQHVKTRCTGCSYCQPCPRSVKIPDIFQAYDHSLLHANPESFKREYGELIETKNDASLCVQCRKCEGACPQHLPITRYLAEIDAEMAGLR